jgi:lipopolysaccharide transport system permease protein
MTLDAMGKHPASQGLSAARPWRKPRASGGNRAVLQYLIGVWSARHFWTHLALADLRARWRRSYLGVSWSILQPLGMTLLIAFVLGRLMKIDVVDYAPYILSGIIFWEFISATTMSGALAFIQNEPYIKQHRHPLAIYTLRVALMNVIVLMLASIGLFGWILVVRPGNISLSWLALPFAVPILFLTAWPLATIFAYLTARFRDIPHALGLVLQALWFISPVYFEVRFFREAGLNALVDYNPVYHLLETFRAPLLAGQWPAAENYLVGVATAAVLTALAMLAGWRCERNVIFYL